MPNKRTQRPKSSRSTRAREAKQRELRDLVKWLIAHDDASGLNEVIAAHLDVGCTRDNVWPAAGLRALFAVIVRYASAPVLAEMIDGAKKMRATLVKVENQKQAAALLGVTYEDIDCHLGETIALARSASAEVH